MKSQEILASGRGLGLEEFFNEERRKGHLTRERRVEIMSAQLVSLEAKATELEVMISYVRAKINWLKGDQQDPEPDFENYARMTTTNCYRPSCEFAVRRNISVIPTSTVNIELGISGRRSLSG